MRVSVQQKRSHHKRAGGGDPADEAGRVQTSSNAVDLKDEIDEILDEIDSLLEENAEEFVKAYVQKGGE